MRFRADTRRIEKTSRPFAGPKGGVIVDDETVTGMQHDQWQGRSSEPSANEHDQVGTVEVQILLSWFFETSTPGEVSTELPRAA
jgi:hypothetical protein